MIPDPPGARVTEAKGDTMTIYRYGGLAWFWRILCLFALAGGGLCLFAAVRFGSWAFVGMAVPLLLPPLALGGVVATRVELDGDVVRVHTLALVRRTVHRSALGRPRARRKATALFTQVHAPRVWIPVRGGLPLYLDLLADVPDPQTFRRVFPIPRDMARGLGSGTWG